MTSRNWLCTNWNLEEKISPIEKIDMTKIKYFVGQLEEGKKKKGQHFQFYLVLHKPNRLSYVKKMFPSAHIEKRKGSHEQAKAYCTKEEGRVSGPYEYGTAPPGQGSRTRLVTIKEQIDNGATAKDIAEDHFGHWVKYNRSFDKYIMMKRPARNEMTIGHYIYGDAGIGKSTLVKERFPDAEYIQYDGKYFSDYNGGDTIIFDDVDMQKFDRATLLQLCNHTPYDIRCMGKYVPFNAKVVVFVQNTLDTRFVHDTAISRRYAIENLGSERLF